MTDDVMALLLRGVGKRITGINETTRDAVLGAVRQAVEEGVAAGESGAQLGDRIEAIRIKDLPVFGEYRAELIARTETAQMLNQANLESYREYGVGRVQAVDGDKDPECAARNGRTFAVAEAMGIVDHPAGTLDWVPVIDQPSA